MPPLPDTVLEEWAWAMGPLLQCLHTHEGTLVHFVSVCTSVVRAYLWVYVCLLSVIVICIFMRVCVTRME